MKRFPIHIILIIAVTFVAGCNLFGSKRSANFVSQSSSFPMATGSTWTYAVYDSTTSDLKRDTMRVNILQTDSTSGQVQSLWTLQYHQLVDSTVGNIVYPWVVLRVLHTDSMAVGLSANTLRFSFPRSGVVTKIIYPLEVGKKWTDNNSSYSVISKDFVHWDGGKSHESYQIVQEINSDPNNTITYWIEPNVGIVKVHYDEILGGLTPTQVVWSYIATWTLLSTTVK